jgi:hypothetical protein
MKQNLYPMPDKNDEAPQFTVLKISNLLKNISFSVGGNPSPRLLWYLDERRLEGRAEPEEEGRAISRLRLPVSREDHGRRLRCEARHEALSNPMSAEAALSIQCKLILHLLSFMV